MFASPRCQTEREEASRPMMEDPNALSPAEWRAQAVSLLKSKTAMPEREWVRLYSEGRSPEEAAAIAETYSYNPDR
jgi:hypothetical protein